MMFFYDVTESECDLYFGNSSTLYCINIDDPMSKVLQYNLPPGRKTWSVGGDTLYSAEQMSTNDQIEVR